MSSLSVEHFTRLHIKLVSSSTGSVILVYQLLNLKTFARIRLLSADKRSKNFLTKIKSNYPDVSIIQTLIYI